jgi:hypothetical protein
MAINTEKNYGWRVWNRAWHETLRVWNFHRWWIGIGGILIGGGSPLSTGDGKWARQ